MSRSSGMAGTLSWSENRFDLGRTPDRLGGPPTHCHDGPPGVGRAVKRTHAHRLQVLDTVLDRNDRPQRRTVFPAAQGSKPGDGRAGKKGGTALTVSSFTGILRPASGFSECALKSYNGSKE